MQDLSLPMMIFTDFAVNRLTNKDLKNWFETKTPIEFLRQKIPNFDKLFLEELKKKIC